MRGGLRLALALGLAGGAPGGAVRAQDAGLASDAHVRAARLVVERLSAGAFDSVAAAVDPAVPAGTFSVQALGRMWSAIIAQEGALQSLRPLRAFRQQGYQDVDFAAVFQRQEMTLRMALDAQDRLSGFWLLAPTSAVPATAAYVDTAAFTERSLTIGVPGWELPAVLTLPRGSGPFPGVVLVHGSGPNDRDESAGPNRPFRDLAGGLASRGIAVLRYDKRTLTHGARFTREMGLEEEVVADALAALDTLRRQGAVDRRAIFLLGHSLGATLAPRIAERDGGLAGAILLAAAARPLTVIHSEQLRYLALVQGAVSPRMQAMIARSDSVRDGQPPDDAPAFGAAVRYWRELDAIRPTRTARRIRTPLLLLQGGRDYQVTPAELATWRRELGDRPRTDFREYPALNHLFLAGTGASTPAEYQLPGHVDPEVVQAVADWILQVAPRRRRAGA